MNDIKIENNEKIKKYIPLSKRQDKPDSVIFTKQINFNLKRPQNWVKLVGITKNSANKVIRNKSYWNF